MQKSTCEKISANKGDNAHSRRFIKKRKINYLHKPDDSRDVLRIPRCFFFLLSSKENKKKQDKYCTKVEKAKKK